MVVAVGFCCFASIPHLTREMWVTHVECRFRLSGRVAMFEDFSERARRIIFLSRKMAGRRGASAIGVDDLIEALVVEDQGDFLKLFREDASGAVRPMPQYRAFLSAETAAEIQQRLEPLLPKANPSPDSVEMPVSDALEELLAAAIKLGEELRGEPAMPSRIQVGHVEPLHLLAAALSDETSATAEVLKQAGISNEAVIAAIKTGEYS
jgi:Clp amino terminal domain, pathogenicity island component